MGRQILAPGEALHLSAGIESSISGRLWNMSRAGHVRLWLVAVRGLLRVHSGSSRAGRPLGGLASNGAYRGKSGVCRFPFPGLPPRSVFVHGP